MAFLKSLSTPLNVFYRDLLFVFKLLVTGKKREDKVSNVR
jgi:hypothetical protein